ncbi:DUF2840 domain-containing protein [Sphingomonas oligoaromativorans]|uniref:DUF2840 domain-containing protein n=1 Tax=Sphingomonas oligoaromativorans TaxID=575322 RepID=UPI00141F61E9|nr:DUF2840 domain-containing protein [Sphingomonas oligoaromativorans]NIJ34073.1 hypothetical protein [Sphingomonas oligoaromativorans]
MSASTLVSLTWIEGEIEQWLRFGREIGDRIVDRRRRELSFAPGSIFALVRWTANEFGTATSDIAIVRAVSPGEPYSTTPLVDPGAELLLATSSWRRVETVLAAIDAVEAAGVDPCDAAPDHWRHVHNRIAAGMRPRAYSPSRHRAWQLRSAVA